MGRMGNVCGMLTGGLMQQWTGDGQQRDGTLMPQNTQHITSTSIQPFNTLTHTHTTSLLPQPQGQRC